MRIQTPTRWLVAALIATALGACRSGVGPDDASARAVISVPDPGPPQPPVDPFTAICHKIKGPPLLVSGPGNSAAAIADELCDKLARAHDFDTAGDAQQRNNMLDAFNNNVSAQSGKRIKATDADGLIAGATALMGQPSPIP